MIRLAAGTCDIFWGSHGCELRYGHAGHHVCCCDCGDHAREHEENGCVGAWPYYGPATRFFTLDEGIGR